MRRLLRATVINNYPRPRKEISARLGYARPATYARSLPTPVQVGPAWRRAGELPCRRAPFTFGGLEFHPAPPAPRKRASPPPAGLGRATDRAYGSRAAALSRAAMARPAPRVLRRRTSFRRGSASPIRRRGCGRGVRRSRRKEIDDLLGMRAVGAFCGAARYSGPAVVRVGRGLSNRGTQYSPAPPVPNTCSSCLRGLTRR